jgi:TolB-like protein
MPATPCYEFGYFRLDTAGPLLTRGRKTIDLPPKAAYVLLMLVENAGSVVEKEDLLKKVWHAAFIEEGSLTRTVSILRKALGDKDSKFIATVSKRGYRFVARTREVEGESAAWAKRKIMLAVLPFENFSRNSKEDYFSDGLTEEMITQLGRLNPPRLGVIARASIMKYKGTDKGVEEIGKELRVDYILSGSARRVDDRVRIAAQLIRVRDSTHLWAENYERDLGDILVLQSQIALAIASQIAIKLTPQEKVRLAGVGAVDPDLYLDHLWAKRTPKSLLLE